MEKKEEITLIDAFKDFKEEKNIDRPVMTTTRSGMSIPRNSPSRLSVEEES